MLTVRRLTDEEQVELDSLNSTVNEAIRARRSWLDVKMKECSSLQVGDEIYDVRNGRKLGVVSELYRFDRDRDEGVRDTSHYCDYRYQTYSNCFDNTSRQTDLYYGTRQDALMYAEGRVSHLRSGIL